MGVTQARKFQNYTPQKILGAKIKVLRFHWMRVYMQTVNILQLPCTNEQAKTYGIFL